jgi:hypothetical protein
VRVAGLVMLGAAILALGCWIAAELWWRTARLPLL